MKMTLADVKVRQQALAEIAPRRLPGKLAYAIGKNLMALQEAAELIERQRVAIAESYAKKDEEGKPIVKDNSYDMENMEAFKTEFGEFLAEEEEIEVRTVPVSVLEMLDEARFYALSPAEMIAIDFMLEE